MGAAIAAPLTNAGIPTLLLAPPAPDAGAGRDAVKVRGILFEEPCETAGDRLRLLSRAIDEARLPPRTKRGAGPPPVADAGARRLLPR